MNSSVYHFCFHTDTFELEFLGNEKKNRTMVQTTYKNIAWKSDRETKFQNPDKLSEFDDFAKPPNWPKPANELDPEEPNNNGFQNQGFIVWMRTAAFPKFRKPYRKVDHDNTFRDSLPKGKYMLHVHYSILFCVYFQMD